MKNSLSRIRFQVSGMSCAGCASKLQKNLMSQEGVLEAIVNPVTDTAEITWQRPATEKSLLHIAHKTGFPMTAQNRPKTVADTPPSTRNLIVCAALSLPVMVLEMGAHIFPSFHHWQHQALGQTGAWAVQALLITLLLLFPGRSIFRTGFRTLVSLKPDMNALVALGAGAAFLYSCLVLIAPSALPADARGVYFEAVGVILTLILLGRYLEGRAKQKTGSAVQELLALQPKTATVWIDGKWQQIDSQALEEGARIQVKPGSAIPCDGTIVQGESWIDEAMLTGEPMPRAAGPRDAVYAGTMNTGLNNTAGTLEIETTSKGSEGVLSQIVDLVVAAQSSRIPAQKLIDQITLWFVPLILMISLLSGLAWLLNGAPDQAFVSAISVLIIACPCAMGLAVPLSVVVSTGRAAKAGILMRNGAALQSLSKVQHVVFDKTGTLTQGRPTIQGVACFNGAAQEDSLQWAASLESHSSHPIARAFLQANKRPLLPVTQQTEVTARGLTGQIDGSHFHLGSLRYMQDNAINMLHDGLEGQTLLAKDNQLIAAFTLEDPIKVTSIAAVGALTKMGITCAIVSGDAHKTTAQVAKSLGITCFESEATPASKAAFIADLQNQSTGVVFVGDGINDAPALTQANVGIAIGTGTDIAIEAADVVLTAGDPEKVGQAVKLSKQALGNMKQNLFWAFAYNVALIPVASGALIPVAGLSLTPVMAAAAMSASSLLVAGNALRLKAKRL